MATSWRICWTDQTTGEEHCDEVILQAPWWWRRLVPPPIILGPGPTNDPDPIPWYNPDQPPPGIDPGLWDPPRQPWFDDLQRLAGIDQLLDAVRDDNIRLSLRETLRSAANHLAQTNAPDIQLNITTRPY